MIVCRKLILFSVLCLLAVSAFGQSTELTPLFQDEKPLSIRLAYSFKEIRKNTLDSVYVTSVLYYKNDQEGWDSLNVRVRGRGNFRRKNCFFTPMKVKIKKSDSKGTLFEGNKNLKLVLPCQVSKNYDDLVIREYMCYQFYEPATLYSFNTRLLNVTLLDEGRKKPRSYQVAGFFIEDDNIVAKRFDGKVIERVGLHPMQLNDTSTLKHDFFEFMIANTDYSSSFQHNNKMIQTGEREFVPVPYDFDMSGFVDAPYATHSERLDITSVRQRVYRGYCRDESVTQFVRTEYIKAKPAIMKVFDDYANYFNEKEFAAMKKYISGFFDLLEDDLQFRVSILQACRTK